MSSITSANAVYLLSITDLFDVPQQLQGFAADDIFDTEALDSTEILMGVDGRMSAGFVFVTAKQSISIQADSPSIALFEQWYAAQQQARELFFANGTVVLQAIGLTYTLTNGVLSSYPPMSDAKKVLQPRKFGITWESIDSAPI